MKMFELVLLLRQVTLENWSHDMWSLQLTFLSMRSMGNRKSPLIAKVVTSVILDLNVQ